MNVLDRIDIQAYPAPVIRPFQTEVKVKKKKTRGIAFVDVLVGKGAVLQGKSGVDNGIVFFCTRLILSFASCRSKHP